MFSQVTFYKGKWADEVNDAVKEAEPMLKKFVVRLLPALADAL